MAETPDPPGRTTLNAIPLNRKWLNPKGGSFYFIPVPVEFYQPIGAVTAFWGFLEPALDTVSEALQGETNHTETGWRHMSFRKRNRLLRKVVRLAFAQSPQIESAFTSIIDEAVDIQWKRNLLVHGQYTFIFPGGGGPGRLEVHGMVRGKLVVLQLTLEEVGRMWHRIGELISELSNLFDPKVPVAPLSSPDRSRLQEILRRHLNGATQPILQPRPSPSPA